MAYNNFIEHGEVYAQYTSKSVKYIPSISIGLGLNLYEKLSKNVSFLHGLDFGYNIYSKKQANIVYSNDANIAKAVETINNNDATETSTKTATDPTTETKNRRTRTNVNMEENNVSNENNDTNYTININLQDKHNEIEQERKRIIERNLVIVQDIEDALRNKYFSDIEDDDDLNSSDLIYKESDLVALIERLNYSKFTVEEIAQLIADTHAEKNRAIPLMDVDYDDYLSFGEAYDAYLKHEGELEFIDDADANDENATKYAMLKTGLIEKPTDYKGDPYSKYNDLVISFSKNDINSENKEEEQTNEDNTQENQNNNSSQEASQAENQDQSQGENQAEDQQNESESKNENNQEATTNQTTENQDKNINQILKTTYSFVERYYVMYRIGFNIKQTQNVALQPFLNIGLNIGELHISKLYSTNIVSTSKKFKAGFSMGIGMDVIIKDRFVIGLNYRLSINKYNNIAKFYTHCFALKFGIAFL